MSPSVADPNGPGLGDTRKCVLLVEDEFLIRWALSDCLREGGYHVIEACDATEALTILDSVCPDIVISDVRMPGSFDGMALLSHIKRTSPVLPVIIMSGHFSSDQALRAGATKFVAKPCILGAVLEAVAEGLTGTP